MDFNSLIGYEINDAICILKRNTSKKIIIKDNNSNVKNYNNTSVVRITEEKDFIEVITSNFVFLD